jgi:hypothetical protein
MRVNHPLPFLYFFTSQTRKACLPPCYKLASQAQNLVSILTRCANFSPPQGPIDRVRRARRAERRTRSIGPCGVVGYPDEIVNLHYRVRRARRAG